MPSLLRKRGGSDFLKKKKKIPAQGWGEYVAMAVGLIIASDGKSWRREGNPFMAASSEMQGGCQCVSMPGGEEWM